MIRRASSASGGVREVAVPPAARALCTLAEVDYEDAFLVEVGQAQDRPEQWARALMEDAPILMRRVLAAAFFALRLQLGPARDDRFVLGWEVRRSTPDVALLGARSSLGLHAELLFKRQQGSLLFATFVQHENRLTRALWTGATPVHLWAARYLLGRAERSLPQADRA